MSLQPNIPMDHYLRYMDATDLQPLRILLLEQHPSVRRALVIRLLSSPLVERVMTTTLDGVTAKYLKKNKPDIILLGLPYSVSGGLPAVAKQVQKIFDQDQLIIALTSYAGDEERETLQKAGISRYLLKDINTPLLLDEIVSALRRSDHH